MREIVFIHPDWSIRVVDSPIGAKILGPRLTGDLPPETVDGIRRALAYYKALFSADGSIATAPRKRPSPAISPVPSPTRRSRRGPTPKRSSNSTRRARLTTAADAMPRSSLPRPDGIVRARGIR